MAVQAKAFVYLCAYADERKQCIANQEAICNKRANMYEVEVVDTFQDVGIDSKELFDRVGLQRMIDSLAWYKQHVMAVDYVLIAEVDRLVKVDASSVSALLSISSKICKTGVSIVDTNEEQHFWIRGFDGNGVFEGQRK